MIESVKPIHVIGGGRNLIISLLRLIAMLLIIFCHICQYYDSEWAWWLNVGVQIFFILSGYLYGSKSIDEPVSWFKRQLIKILVPYWAFLTIAILTYGFICPANLSVTNVIRSYLTVGTLNGIGHLWFVNYILFCYLITPYLGFLRDYLSRYSLRRTLLVLITVFGIYSILSIFLNIHFRPGEVCCYILGYFISSIQSRTQKDVIKICAYLSIPLCLMSNALFCYLKYVKGVEMYQGHFVHITDYSHLFLGLAITMCLMTCVKQVKANSMIAFSDKYSYEIYLVHQLFILSPLILLGVTDLKIFNMIITISVIVIAGILLNVVSKRIKSWCIVSSCH